MVIARQRKPFAIERFQHPDRIHAETEKTALRSRNVRGK
jgi:hypothetical protein